MSKQNEKRSAVYKVYAWDFTFLGCIKATAAWEAQEAWERQARNGLFVMAVRVPS